MCRTPFALRDKIDTMVKEMAEQGVIRPSRSPWSSPVVLLRKKDHTVILRRLSQIELHHEDGWFSTRTRYAVIVKVLYHSRSSIRVLAGGDGPCIK